jgi:molybdopterin adenylyltransferase
MNAHSPIEAPLEPATPPLPPMPKGAGGRYDEARAFRPVRVAVLTVSDTRDAESDTSGNILAERIAGAGHAVSARAIVPDDVDAIRAQVTGWIAEGANVVITTGGTGITGRDVTPEALEPLFQKRLEGFAVAFHMVSFAAIGTSTLQSRATAGILDGAFVFCLPGSNGAVKDGWSVIAPQLDTRHAPCNMVELIPRLQER